MITRILYSLPDKNKLLTKREVSLIKGHTARYKIDNTTVYDILDQICNDTDLYPHVKQHKSRGIAERHFMPFTTCG